MEHLLNVYAARHARGAVADFLGYCEVEYGQASGKLSEGVWLVRHHAYTSPQATCHLTEDRNHCSAFDLTVARLFVGLLSTLTRRSLR